MCRNVLYFHRKIATMNENVIRPRRSIGISLNQLRQETRFTDLVFICHQNSHSVVAIHAHQVIFSALSTKLKNLFDIANHIQPYEQVMVTLDSVNSTIMEKLVEYIYIGETKANINEQLELIKLCSLLKLNVPISKLYWKTSITLERLNLTTSEGIPYGSPFSSWNKIKNEQQFQIKNETSKYCSEANEDKANDKGRETDLNNLIDFITEENSVDSSECISKATKVTDPIDTNIYSYVEEMIINEVSNKINEINPKLIRNFSKEEKKAHEIPKCMEDKSIGNDSHASTTDWLQPERAFCRDNFQCKFCCASLRYGQVSKHIEQVHDKINRFICEKCSYSTYTLCNLKRHANGAHGVIKRFKCRSCDFSTACATSLRRHYQATHLKLKMQCPHCEYFSYRKDKLKVHINSLHLKLKKQCPNCEYFSYRSDRLKIHIDKIHLKRK